MNVFTNYRSIYTYSYGNVSGFDVSKARGVEEFYAILRSSLWPLQYVTDTQTLRTILNHPNIQTDNSVGLTLATATQQISAQIMQTLLLNERSKGVYVHRMSINLNTFACGIEAQNFFRETKHLTSLLINVSSRQNVLIQIFNALQQNRSLVLLDVMYMRGDQCYTALANLIASNNTLCLLKLRFASKLTNRQRIREMSAACQRNRTIVNFFGCGNWDVQKHIWRNWWSNIVKRSYLENSLRTSYSKYIKKFTTIKNQRFPVFVSSTDGEQRQMFLEDLFNKEVSYESTRAKTAALNTFLASCVSRSRNEPEWGIEEVKKVTDKLSNYDNLELDRKEMYYFAHLDPFYHFSTSLTKQAGNYYFTQPSFFQNLKSSLTIAQLKSLGSSVGETLKFNWMKNEQGKFSYAKLELTFLENFARMLGVDVEALKADTEKGEGSYKKMGKQFMANHYKLSKLPMTYESYKTVDLLVTELKEEFENHFSLFHNVCGNGLHIVLVSERALGQDMKKIQRLMRNFHLGREAHLKLMVVAVAPQATDLSDKSRRAIEEAMKQQEWYDSPHIVRQRHSGYSFFTYKPNNTQSLLAIKRKIAQVGKRSPLCNTDIELFYYQMYGFLTQQLVEKPSPILKKREALGFLQDQYPNLSEELLRTELKEFIRIFSAIGLLVYCKGSESYESTLVFDKEWLIDQASLLSFMTEGKKKHFLSKVKEIDTNFHNDIQQQMSNGILTKDFLEIFWKEEDYPLLEYYSIKSLLLHPLKRDQEQLFLFSDGLRKVDSKFIDFRLRQYKHIKAVFEAENRGLGSFGLFHRVCSMFEQQVAKANYFSNFAEFEFKEEQETTRFALLFDEDHCQVHLFIELTGGEKFVGLELVEMVRSFIKFISESQYESSTVYETYLETNEAEAERVEFNKAKAMVLKPWFASRKESFNHIRLSDVSDLL